MKNLPVIQNVFDIDLPVVSHGRGVFLWDEQGKQYIDGASGAVVTALGHGDPRIVAALRAQAERVTFTHRGAFTSAPLREAAERLSRMTGFPGVWFVSSGSESVEAAMQFALQYFQEIGEPERTVFMSSKRSYHGNTLGALSASGHGRRKTVEPIALKYTALPAVDRLRGQGGMSDDEFTAALLEQARGEFERRQGTLAAVILEPVGGATLGATTLPTGYFRGIKKLCEEFGSLFIADEVMTGLGRTGTILASYGQDVSPDIVAMGKGVGAGYTPIAATLVGDRVLDAIAAGSAHVLGGHTYAGNPLSTAVAAEVLRIFEEDAVLESSKTRGIQLRSGLERLRAEHPVICDVRGEGMLEAIELTSTPGQIPAGDHDCGIAHELFDIAMGEGLVIYPTTGGFVDAVIVAPPLTITESELNDLFSRLDRALTRLESKYL